MSPRRLVSFACGVTIALSGFFISHLFAGHRNLIVTAAYLPWMLALVQRVARDGELQPLACLTLGGAMWLSGHYQMIYIGAMGACLFGILSTISEHGWSKGLRTAGKTLISLAIIVQGGAVLGAVQILPMLDAVELSQRAEGSVAFAGAFSSAPENLLSFLYPNAFGNKLDAPFVGDFAYWESLSYIGVLPLLLALLALVRLPARRTLPLLVPALLGIVLSLGEHTPVFGWFVSHMPGAQLFRAAGRYVVLSCLFLSPLSALGLEALLFNNTEARWRTNLVVIATATLGCLGMLLWISLGDRGPANAVYRVVLDSLPSQLEPSHDELIRQDSWRAMTFGLILVAATVLLRFFQSRAVLIGVGLCGVIAFDLLTFGHGFLRTGPRAQFELPSALVERVSAAGHGTRMIPPWDSRSGNFPAMYGLGNPGGYDILVDGRYARYLNRAKGSSAGDYVSMVKLGKGSVLLHHLGARFLVTARPESKEALERRGYPGFKYVGVYDGLTLYEDVSAAPRATLVHRVEVLADENEILSRMESPSFKLDDVAFIEEPINAEHMPVALAAGSVSERVEIIELSPNRVRIEVETAKPAALVLSDTLHPGWKATIDGDPAPLVAANQVMRLVPIPAGNHVVEMRYLPRSFIIGLVFTLLALAGLGIAAFGRR
jgi:hypothetical protein